MNKAYRHTSVGYNERVKPKGRAEWGKCISKWKTALHLPKFQESGCLCPNP